MTDEKYISYKEAREDLEASIKRFDDQWKDYATNEDPCADCTRIDDVYRERNQLVAFLSKMFPSSLGEHEGEDWDDDWRTVVYILSPEGQLSWHIHDNDKVMFTHLKYSNIKWDGHTTEEKYQRLAQLQWLDTF